MEITDEKIKEWKAKYGDNLFVITTNKNGETKTAVLRKPDRKTLSYAGVAGQNDSTKFSEVILNSCWVDGDEEIKTDDAHFFGASKQLAEMIEVAESDIKKL